MARAAGEDPHRLGALQVRWLDGYFIMLGKSSYLSNYHRSIQRGSEIDSDFEAVFWFDYDAILADIERRYIRPIDAI